MARRIALVSSSYHPYPGGVEEHVRNLAAELTRRGHEVVVWTVDRGEQLGVQIVDGVPVHYLSTPLPARDTAALARFATRAPVYWRRWSQAHRRFGPDLLHVHCFGPNGLYALALHRRFGTPLVLTSHGETFADDHGVFDESALARWGLRAALRAAPIATAPSGVVCEDLRARFAAHGCEIVPNGIDLNEGRPGGRRERLPGAWPNDGRVVLALGRLEHIKGFDLLLRSFAVAAEPGEHLVIAGDGSQRAQLEEVARRLGVLDRVFFPGRLDRPQVLAAMGAAVVVVVPSRLEAFGIVALEAWRAGRPLVMTTRGGASDFVVDGVNGLLVDPEDEHSLAGAIRSVLDNATLADRLGAAGQKAVQRFTWDRVARDYESVYDRILARAGSR